MPTQSNSFNVGGVDIVAEEWSDEEGSGECASCGGQCLDPEHGEPGRLVNDQAVCYDCNPET